jgi:2'-5' RNA ligase
MYHFTHANPCTMPVEDRDYNEWRRDRERYGVWMIDLDTPEIGERVSRARHHLDGLLSVHQRPPHITLFVCGFYVDALAYDDDFNPAMLASQCRRLQSTRIRPFSLRIGGLDSFDSAVFLQVNDDSGGLMSLRNELAKDGTEIRQASYTAHLTVGLYQGAFEKREVTQRLRTFNDSPPLVAKVHRIHFAVYSARTLSGAFDILQTHKLG